MTLGTFVLYGLGIHQVCPSSGPPAHITTCSHFGRKRILFFINVEYVHSPMPTQHPSVFETADAR